MPGKKYRSIRNPKAYEALKSKFGKKRAAAISNSIGKRKKGRRKA